MLVQNGGKVVTYPVSTSIFGLGDAWGRMTTPLGYLAVEKKIGDNSPKLAKAPRLQPTNTFAAVSAKPQSQDQTISTPASGATLSVEQMRMRGALAAQRQKAKLELDKRL